MTEITLRTGLLEHLSPHIWKTGRQLRIELLRRTKSQGRLSFGSRLLYVPGLYVELNNLEEEKLVVSQELSSENAMERREYLLTSHGVKERIGLQKARTDAGEQATRPAY